MRGCARPPPRLPRGRTGAPRSVLTLGPGSSCGGLSDLFRRVSLRGLIKRKHDAVGINQLLDTLCEMFRRRDARVELAHGMQQLRL